MNVVCGQCGTGYEFDDALVSDRGTTVRCTQCGFQFRVHSNRGPGNAPERWIVRKATGEEYIFRSLSELQRAIGQRRVVISDSLSRDGATFRPLNQLSELDSFFTTQILGTPVAADSAPADTDRTRGKRPVEPLPRGVASATPSIVAKTPLAEAAAPPDASARASNTNALDENTPRGGFTTNPPGGVATGGRVSLAPAGIGGPRQVPRPTDPKAVLPNVVPAPVTPPVGGPGFRPPLGAPSPVAIPSPIAGPNAPLPGQLAYAPTLESERVSIEPPSDDRPTPTGALPRRRRSLRADAEDNTLASRNRLPSAPHLLESLTAPPRKRFGGPRWIVAVVLLGGGVLVAATVGRSYFASFRQDAASAVDDPRVASFLTAGDEAFAAGDLEEARAQFEKASALVESVDVLHRLLSVDVFRADGDWLQLKIIPVENSERKPIESDFRERCLKIQSRVTQLQRLSAGGPASAAATLALIDASRVLGQVHVARALVERSSGLGDEPREAYVSAMLDVSEPNPAWGGVIPRLKGAAAAERGVPRAQAALVYALISSKDFVQAQQELDVLRARKRQHPATAVLERYLSESQQTAQRGSTQADTLPPQVGDSVERSGEGREGSVGRAADPMAEAAEARAAGELARAARLYSQALSQQPGNVAAMTGLGDVARSQGNTDIALSHYGAALRANPNHGPAVLACADLKWSLGDRAGAVELYRRLSDGPQRVHDRVLEFEKAAAKAAQAGGVQPSAETAVAPPSEAPAPESSSMPVPAPPESPMPSPVSSGSDEVKAPAAETPPPGPPSDIQLK